MAENRNIRKIDRADLLGMIERGDLSTPPLEVRLVEQEARPDVDAVLDVVWRGVSCRYAAELKRDAKPQTLRLAVDQIKKLATQSRLGLPMIIAPHLSEDKMRGLLDHGVSALDGCGNAALEAPGQFHVWRSGQPNQYPDSAPIRSAYRGASSLVARVMLLQPEFNSIGAVRDAIRQRGGALSLGAVSKALQRLEADLIIDRPTRHTVRLLQPERLLDQLLDAYQPPKARSTWLGKAATPTGDLMSGLAALAAAGGLVRTGQHSAGEYAAWAGEPVIACYCQAEPAGLLQRLRVDARETLSFPNLRLTWTDDPRVYFDPRPNLAASPVQAWLEMAHGDKRQKQTGEQIRKLLLQSAPWSSP